MHTVVGKVIVLADASPLIISRHMALSALRCSLLALRHRPPPPARCHRHATLCVRASSSSSARLADALSRLNEAAANFTRSRRENGSPPSPATPTHTLPDSTASLLQRGQALSPAELKSLRPSSAYVLACAAVREGGAHHARAASLLLAACKRSASDTAEDVAAAGAAFLTIALAHCRPSGMGVIPHAPMHAVALLRAAGEAQRKAAGVLHPWTAYALAHALEAAESGDDDEIITLWRTAVASGVCPPAPVRLAAALLAKRPQSVQEALQVLAHACRAGDPHAAAMLSTMYTRGMHVPRDDATALKLLKLAAAGGNGRAAHNAGVAALQAGNEVEALSMFHAGAAAGYAPAALNALHLNLKRGDADRAAAMKDMALTAIQQALDRGVSPSVRASLLRLQAAAQGGSEAGGVEVIFPTPAAAAEAATAVMALEPEVPDDVILAVVAQRGGVLDATRS